MPLQENATLTLVVGAGVADDWDRAGTAGPQKWAGSVRAYYRERTDRQTAGTAGDTAAVDVLERRELILETDDLDQVDELDTDDVITFRVDGESTDRTATVKAIRANRLAGIRRDLQTAKLTLADA